MASGRGGSGGSGGSGCSGNGGTSRTPAEKFDDVVGGGYYTGQPEVGQSNPTPGTYVLSESSDNGSLGVVGYSAGLTNAEARAASYAEDGTAYAGVGYGISAGPVSNNYDLYGRADFRVHDPVNIYTGDGVIHIGAEAEGGTDIDIGPVGINGSGQAGVGVNASRERTQFGADASVDANVTVGGGGNEISAGVGYGGSLGIDLVHGEDSDGDGRGEIGFSLDFKAGVGGNVGFRFEPETVAEEVRSWFGGNEPAKVSREASYPFSCCDRFEAALEMPDTQAATARLQSLL